jgi:hypothetical protein
VLPQRLSAWLLSFLLRSRPRPNRRRERDEAHLPAQQQEACPEARFPAQDVDPRRPSGPEGPSAAWSCTPLRLIAAPVSLLRRARRVPSIQLTPMRQSPMCNSNGFGGGQRFSPFGGPGDVLAPAPSGYTTSLRCPPTSLAGSLTPYPVGWAKRRSAIGVGVVFARSLGELCRMCHLGPISSGSSPEYGTSRFRN